MTVNSIWKAVPAERFGKDRWLVENQEGSVLGFRHFPKRAAHFIAYMETHYPDALVTKDFNARYMDRLRRNQGNL